MAANDLDIIRQRTARVTYALSVTALIIALAFVSFEVLRFLGHIRTVTTIVVGAVFFSYLVAPLVRVLRRRLPMWASVLIVYVIILLVITALAWLALPLIIAELRQFAADRPALTSAIAAYVSANGPLAQHLPAAVKQYLSTIPAQFSDMVARNGVAFTTNALTVILSAASSLVLLILVPIFAAYAMMDGDWLLGALFGLFPPGVRQKAQEFVSAVNGVLAGYIRGQLLVAAAVGSLVAILLLSSHVKYAFAIGLLAGVFELVPYLGAIAGAIPGVTVALITNGWQNALLVALGFLVINQLSGHVLSPLIVGDSIKIRPIFILLALLIGGELLRLPGLLIAVPVAGIIRAIIVTFVPFDQSTLPPAPPRAKKPPWWIRIFAKNRAASPPRPPPPSL